MSKVLILFICLCLLSNVCYGMNTVVFSQEDAVVISVSRSDLIKFKKKYPVRKKNAWRKYKMYRVPVRS